jgi:hypothetical protein
MRHALKILTLSALFLTGSLPGLASASDYKGIIHEFFSLIESGKGVAAIEFIYSSNPWMKKKSDAVENVKGQFRNLENLVGSFCTHELLVEQPVGKRFVHLIYLAAYDRQPLRFVFQFYKPKEKWIIFSFSFDDKLDNEVEKLANDRLTGK